MPDDLRTSPSDSRDEGLLPSVADVPLAIARWCARQGWPVHPLAPGRKTPAANCEPCRQPGHSHAGRTCPVEGRWCHSFHAATLDQRRIDRWWGDNPQFGTGVACGPAGLIVIDSSFQVLVAVITAGQRGDAPLFTEVMNRIRLLRSDGGRPRTRPVHLLADRAYSSRQIREYLRRRQVPHTIPEKRDQAEHRSRRGSAGGRPPSFDREQYKARHTVENRIALLKQARAVATRYDKLAVRYEATVQLALIRQAL
ncbi:bifunctional DNA primase/polymerase [Streptomyces anulatus]